MEILIFVFQYQRIAKNGEFFYTKKIKFIKISMRLEKRLSQRLNVQVGKIKYQIIFKIYKNYFIWFLNFKGSFSWSNCIENFFSKSSNIDISWLTRLNQSACWWSTGWHRKSNKRNDFKLYQQSKFDYFSSLFSKYWLLDVWSSKDG